MNPKAGMLLKTHVEKMSAFRLSKMLMKAKELQGALHDVDEKKHTYRIGESKFAKRTGARSLIPSREPYFLTPPGAQRFRLHRYAFTFPFGWNFVLNFALGGAGAALRFMLAVQVNVVAASLPRHMAA